MTTGLHTAVAAATNGRGAMLFSREFLKTLALETIRTAAAFGESANVEFATGNNRVAARFSHISIDPAQMQAALVEQNGRLGIEVGPGFLLSLEILVPGGGPLYSTVSLTVPQTRFEIRAAATTIRFEPPNELVDAVVTPAPTRAAAIAQSGIDPNELLRVEGSVAYGSGSRLVTSALGTIPDIPLNELFPAFEFGGNLELAAVQGSLVIIPERFEFIGNTGCPKGNATAGMEVLPQQHVDQGMTRTYPVLVTAPDPLPTRRPESRDGWVAAYLPKPLLDIQFGKVAPALTYRDHGNGFIGYDLELSVAIRGVSVTIDAAEMALRLRLDFASWGLAVATIDVPCVGRMDLAQARFEMPKDNETGYVEAIVRLGVDTAGRLLMQTELGATDLGEAMVSVQLFSRYLGMAGGEAAVYGFVADAVIGRVIANNLPGLVFDAISAAVNQHFFVLADLHGLLGTGHRKPNTASWSDDANSVLLGLTETG